MHRLCIGPTMRLLTVVFTRCKVASSNEMHWIQVATFFEIAVLPSLPQVTSCPHPPHRSSVGTLLFDVLECVTNIEPLTGANQLLAVHVDHVQ